MTKLEKFAEVFGFEPDVDDSNILPCGEQCPYYNSSGDGCRCDSNALDWWYSDYEEPKTGHWINCKCDKCGYVVQPWNTTNFCPNCGAKMIEPQESEDKK